MPNLKRPIYLKKIRQLRQRLLSQGEAVQVMHLGSSSRPTFRGASPFQSLFSPLLSLSLPSKIEPTCFLEVLSRKICPTCYPRQRGQIYLCSAPISIPHAVFSWFAFLLGKWSILLKIIKWKVVGGLATFSQPALWFWRGFRAQFSLTCTASRLSLSQFSFKQHLPHRSGVKDLEETNMWPLSESVDQTLGSLFNLYFPPHILKLSKLAENKFSCCLIGLSSQTFVIVSFTWSFPVMSLCVCVVCNLCACTSLNNVPTALFPSWRSLGRFLLGQGCTDPDTSWQEKTSWIPHGTLITASMTRTPKYRMGTPELGNVVVYFNELLLLLNRLLSLLCSKETPREVGETKLWITAF